MIGLVFAGSAQATGTGNYYCGLPSNPYSVGATVHESGPHSGWYFNTQRCAGFTQSKDSAGKYYSKSIGPGTFATLKITSMNVPDAIDQTVFLTKIIYADKWDTLCTAFPAFGNEPMGTGETISFGIDGSGLVSRAYLTEASGEVIGIDMDDNCTSGNKWTSNIYIGPTNGYNPFVEWFFNDGPPNNDVFTTRHNTYKL